MVVSPDDRFAGLINASAERGGWVPGDVFVADSQGEEEPVPARRTRLPILVALAVLTAAALVGAFLLLRPVERHPVAGQQAPEQVAGQVPGAGPAGSPEAAPAGGPSASVTAAPTATTVIVHVTGQVRNPGVVTLGAGSRLQDAVEAAGGLKSAADAEAVNLARVLVDGEQIHIPAEGEEPPAGGPGEPAGEGTTAGGQASGDSTGGGAGAEANGAAEPNGTDTSGGAGPNGGAKIDLNSADSTALQTLPGVGPVTAEAIIAHRQAQPFTRVEDLLLVHGIGPKTYERLKDLVTVG